MTDTTATTTATTPQVIVNRGTGAGGAQTNGNGLVWEERTSNERNLVEKFGFTRTSLGAGKTMYYLCKRFENVQVVFTTQHGLKKILKDSNDGFKISEEDMMIRGFGDILGFKQSGIKNFKLADPVHNKDLFILAEKEIKRIEKTNEDIKRFKALVKLYDRADIINDIV